MFLKKLFFLSFLFLLGCGFSPLYQINSQHNTTLLTQSVYIAPILDYEGYLLRNSLENALNPTKNHSQTHYILNIALDKPVTTEQMIQNDNFATREQLSITAKYKLIDKKTNKVVLSSQTNAIGSYNVLDEPYSVVVAEKRQKQDLIEIISNNISLRVIAYFKQEEAQRENQTQSN